MNKLLRIFNQWRLEQRLNMFLVDCTAENVFSLIGNNHIVNWAWSFCQTLTHEVR